MDEKEINIMLESPLPGASPRKRTRRRAMTVESWARFCFNLNQSVAQVFKDFNASQREQELALNMLLSHYISRSDAQHKEEKN